MLKKNDNVLFFVFCCLLSLGTHVFGLAHTLERRQQVLRQRMALVGYSSLFLGLCIGDQARKELRTFYTIQQQLRSLPNTAVTFEELFKHHPGYSAIIQRYQNYFQKHGLSPVPEKELFLMTPAQFAQRLLECSWFTWKLKRYTQVAASHGFKIIGLASFLLTLNFSLFELIGD